MDSQRTVDHLRDEANARKDTTLGELLDTAAEELDALETERDLWKSTAKRLQGELTKRKRQLLGAKPDECPICLDEVASKDLYSHKCTVDY